MSGEQPHRSPERASAGRADRPGSPERLSPRERPRARRREPVAEPRRRFEQRDNSVELAIRVALQRRAAPARIGHRLRPTGGATGWPTRRPTAPAPELTGRRAARTSASSEPDPLDRRRDILGQTATPAGCGSGVGRLDEAPAGGGTRTISSPDRRDPAGRALRRVKAPAQPAHVQRISPAERGAQQGTAVSSSSGHWPTPTFSSVSSGSRAGSRTSGRSSAGVSTGTPGIGERALQRARRTRGAHQNGHRRPGHPIDQVGTAQRVGDGHRLLRRRARTAGRPRRGVSRGPERLQAGDARRLPRPAVPAAAIAPRPSGTRRAAPPRRGGRTRARAPARGGGRPGTDAGTRGCRSRQHPETRRSTGRDRPRRPAARRCRPAPAAPAPAPDRCPGTRRPRPAAARAATSARGSGALSSAPCGARAPRNQRRTCQSRLSR